MRHVPLPSTFSSILLPAVALVLLAGCATAPRWPAPGPAAPKETVIAVPGDAATITEALLSAQPGTVIDVAAGVYEESFSLKSGVTIRGQGPEATIVRGGRTGTPVLTAAGCESGAVEGCSLQYAGVAPNFVAWIVDSSVELRDCVFSGGTLSGIMLSGSRSRPVLERVLVHDNAESGIVMAEGAAGRIMRCTVWYNGMAGISLDGASPRVERSTVVDNGGAGIWVRGGSTAQLVANVVVGNRWGITAAAAAAAEAPGRPKLEGNLAWDNAAGNFVEVRGGDSDIEADPRFADRANGDFRVAPDSPAILHGEPRGAWEAYEKRPVRREARTMLVPDEIPTIAQALEQALPGDTVLVNPGIYRESLRMREGVTLRGAGNDQVFVRGGGSGRPVLLVQECPTGTIEAISFVFEGSGQDYVGWVIDSSVNVADCVFRDGPLAGLEIRGELSEPVIRRCRVTGNGESGIVVLKNAGGVIESCEVSHNGLHGIAVAEGAQPDLINNTVVDNAEAGIWVRDGVSPNVERNVVVGNLWGISGDGGEVGRANGTPRLSGNLVWDNRSANFVLAARGTGDVEADPRFRHRDGRDYRVAPDSPAVSGGLTRGAYGVATGSRVWRVPAEVDSIQKAIDTAWVGDEIVVAPGVYREMLRPVSGVDVRAEGPGVVIEGGTGEEPAVRFTDCSDVLFAGFTVRYAGTGKAYTVELVRSAVTLRETTVTGASLSGILVRLSNPTLEGLVVRDNAQTGVYFTEGSGGALRRCTVIGNGLNGISVDRGSAPLVEFNTVLDNIGVGIWVRDASTPRLEHNLVAGNTWGISADSGDESGQRSHGAPILRGNVLWQNITVDFERVQRSATDTAADPLFADRNAGDYRLLPGSPAILPDGTVVGAWPVAQ